MNQKIIDKFYEDSLKDEKKKKKKSNNKWNERIYTNFNYEGEEK